jgi:hypothetical protein
MPSPIRTRLAAAERLGVAIETSVVVGDSIWDMLAAVRCRVLGVGLLSGWAGAGRIATIRRNPRLRGSGGSAAPDRRSRRSVVKISPYPAGIGREVARS